MSCLNLYRFTPIGFGAFALLAAAAGFSSSVSLGSRSAITSRRRFESGDHSQDDNRPFKSVNCCASPPVRSIIQICVPLALPGRPERNDRKRPSGLKRGAFSLSGLDVIRNCCAPSQLAIHTSVSLLSAAVSTELTVYATHLPSREDLTSRTSWKPS